MRHLMHQTLAAVAIILMATSVQALEVQAYSADALAKAQKAGQGIALHFHADWCPVCRAQDKVLQGLIGNPDVPGTVFTVDFDHETALKKKLAVRSQSTLVFYKGSVEQSRITGVTDPAELRQAFKAIR